MTQINLRKHLILVTIVTGVTLGMFFLCRAFGVEDRPAVASIAALVFRAVVMAAAAEALFAVIAASTGETFPLVIVGMLPFLLGVIANNYGRGLVFSLPLLAEGAIIYTSISLALKGYTIYTSISFVHN
ncbi:MAG: hypothetical protein NTU97_01315 [Candidatus Magasanikbacteria bacterium]|nr:hypothetical protein [Candidatus Magasanikbacteria bacterium]